MNKFLAILLVLLIGVGIGSYSSINIVSSSESVPANSSKMIDERTVHTKVITANLKDSYIRISFSILTDSKKAAKELSKRDFQYESFIVTALSSYSSVDLAGKSGMIELAELIKAYLNKELNSGEVLEVYVTEKLVS